MRSGDRVRITAQLIQVSSDRHLWAHAYEGDLSDILTLQNQVAADIANQIRIKLTPEERAVLKSTRIVKPAAYEAYFKGRYYWDTRSTVGNNKGDRLFWRSYPGRSKLCSSLCRAGPSLRCTPRLCGGFTAPMLWQGQSRGD
jgi:hypothetical protein